MIRLWTRRGALALFALGFAACAKPNARTAPAASAVPPAQVEKIKTAVAPLVDRSAGTRETLRSENGEVVRVLTGNQEVLVSRRNQDGTTSTACVDSVKGAEHALTATLPAATHREAR